MSKTKPIDLAWIYADLDIEPSHAWWLKPFHSQYWRDLLIKRKTINAHLPIELLREIFLYCIEVNQIKPVQLALVCRHWRSIITTLAHLWSTLKVGSWTERERVASWLQRAHPKKVIIDTQNDDQRQSNTPQFAALQDVLTATGQWDELTLSSLPPDHLTSQLSFQTTGPMSGLKVLHVGAECLETRSSTDLLNLVPTEAPLSDLRLYSSFAITHFHKPARLPILQNITVLVVNGRGIKEPFMLLPVFTRLQVLEVDHLRLPQYEPDFNLPLLHTLQKLQIRASSVQWMGGREFPQLHECAILLPLTWVAIQHHGVQLPSCRKLTYHGFPITIVQHLHAPQVKAMELRSHDCSQQRMYRQLWHLFTVDGRISKLTTLHFRLQCSEKVFIKMLKWFGLLQELVLSIAHCSSSWQCFLESLAARKSTKDWPAWPAGDAWIKWGERSYWDKWIQWCSSQTWHANVLPNLKSLGIQCLNGFSQSECLGNSPLFRLVAWTRAQSSSPLEHLKVWEGKGTTDDIVVDYISSDYLEKHFGTSNWNYDLMIIRGMVTCGLVINDFYPPLLLQLHLTGLFRKLRALIVDTDSHFEIWILPDLEQIKLLKVWGVIIPEYPLNIELPLVHTLQWLDMRFSTISWMLGRTFKALEEFNFSHLKREYEINSGHKELQANLPRCKGLKWEGGLDTPSPFFSCPNVQSFQWKQSRDDFALLRAAVGPLRDILFNSSCLQELRISISDYDRLDAFIRLIFCHSLKWGVWKNIRSVEVEVGCKSDEATMQCLKQVIRHKNPYETLWKGFTVNSGYHVVNLRGSM